MLFFASTELEGLSLLLKEFGPMGAILVLIAYTFRKIVLWATPHAERMIAAYVKRQETMESCQVKLTESTIDIQKENSLVLREIRDKMPLLCMARNYPCLQKGDIIVTDANK